MGAPLGVYVASGPTLQIRATYSLFHRAERFQTSLKPPKWTSLNRPERCSGLRCHPAHRLCRSKYFHARPGAARSRHRHNRSSRCGSECFRIGRSRWGPCCGTAVCCISSPHYGRDRCLVRSGRSLNSGWQTILQKRNGRSRPPTFHELFHNPAATVSVLRAFPKKPSWPQAQICGLITAIPAGANAATNRANISSPS